MLSMYNFLPSFCFSFIVISFMERLHFSTSASLSTDFILVFCGSQCVLFSTLMVFKTILINNCVILLNKNNEP